MAVFTPLSETELRRYAHAFALGELRHAEGVAAGTVNTIYALHTTKGRFVLRMLEGRSLQDAEFEIELTRFLTRRQFPVPRMHVARDGALAVSHGQGQHVFMFDLVPGRTLEAAAIGVGEVQQMADFMGRFHRLGGGFDQPRDSGFSRSVLGAKLRDARAWAPASAQSLLDTLEVEIERPWPNDLPVGPIHSDLFVDNALFLEGQLSAVLDWEMAFRGPLLYDLVVLLNDWCFSGQSFDAQRVKTLLESYGAQRPLLAPEREAFVDLARWVAARFTITRFSDFERPEPGPSIRTRKPYQAYLARLESLRENGRAISEML